MTIKLTAAEKIGDLLSEKGGTVTGDAKKMGISQCTLSDFIRGQRTNITIDTLKKMCEFYNVSADYLLGLSEIKSPDRGVQSICNSSNITESAAIALSKLSSPCSVAFVDALLEADEGLLEMLGNKFIAYQHAKNIIAPTVEKNKDNIKGQTIFIDYEINGERVPHVPIQDVCDYTRFELLRAFMELADAKEF